MFETVFGKTGYWRGITNVRSVGESRYRYTTHAAALLVEAPHYKLEGRGSDSRWCYWNSL